MRLAELQATVHSVLRQDLDVDAGAERLGVPTERLAIYRDFVAAHVTRVLAKVYPYCARLVAPERWSALARQFFREVPAADPDLNAAASPFPEWLYHYIEADVGPLQSGSLAASLPALAQLEWELFAAFAHEADVPATAEAWSVNPTLAVLETPFAVVPWLVAHPELDAVTPDTPPPEPLATAQVILVFRRASNHRVGFHVAKDDLLFALKVASEGVPLETAAHLAGVSPDEALRALGRAADIGLVVGPRQSPTESY